MAQSKQAIKSRIRSINATKKITSAMELIANVKLQKSRNQMSKNKEYALILQDVLGQIVATNKDLENIYTMPHDSTRRLVIVFTSDLGLCGGYNLNMMKLLENINADELIVIGTHQYQWLVNRGYKVINEMTSSDQMDFIKLKRLVHMALDKYIKDEIGYIDVLYTKFINTVSFEASVAPIMPLKHEVTDRKYKETLFEPSADEILNTLIPMMVENLAYNLYMEAKTSENAARRLAMENATDNATELNDKLVLQYNQARQSAITQEITEIIGGANAL